MSIVKSEGDSWLVIETTRNWYFEAALETLVIYDEFNCITLLLTLWQAPGIISLHCPNLRIIPGVGFKSVRMDLLRWVRIASNCDIDGHEDEVTSNFYSRKPVKIAVIKALINLFESLFT